MGLIAGSQAPDPAAPIPGTLSPDRRFYWAGTGWASVLSPDGGWRWEGRAWVKVPGPPVAGHRRAVALQALLAAWVIVVFLDLFVVNEWFELYINSADGTVLPLRWGIASILIALAVAILAISWFRAVGARARRAIRDSQRVGLLLGAWAGLLFVYAVSDVALAEVVRGRLMDGPETRWQVLLSAGLGVVAACAAIGLVRSVMSDLASKVRA